MENNYLTKFKQISEIVYTNEHDEFIKKVIHIDTIIQNDTEIDLPPEEHESFIIIGIIMYEELLESLKEKLLNNKIPQQIEIKQQNDMNLYH